MRSGKHGLSGLRCALRAARAVAAIPLLAGTVWAQQTSARPDGELPLKAVRQIEALLAAKAQRTPAQRKVSSQLLDLAGESIDLRRQSKGAALADELVEVDIRAEVTAAVLERIRALGGAVINSVPEYRAIRARLPIAAVEKLAALDAVQSIRDADVAFTRGRPKRLPSDNRPGTLEAVVTRAVNTSEGDVAHRADAARSTHSVDGAGIGIGVISDGVRTLADRQATDDVAARVTVLPGQQGGPISDPCGVTSNGNEGTAMLEIVHDLAPGAELLFATGINGSAQMAQNIEDLCAAGADVIVDDLGYLPVPAFQDDAIAQAVSAAAANGCYYFSSAGNNGNLSNGTSGVWEGDFAAGPTLTVNGVAVGGTHDFGGGVVRNRIKIANTFPISLHWADPVDGSANDYDLFLVDANDNVLASSTNTQDGTQDPIEVIGGTCSENRAGSSLIIVKKTGAADRYLRLEYVRGSLEVATAGNVFGHSAAENTVSVAAVDVRTAAGAGGVFDGTESVRTSSSDGPRRIFFQPGGAPITPGDFSSTGGKLLQKPDLAAATCVSTSTPGFSTFCGTSASAPHAAAIAALMLEAAGGPAGVTPAALRTAMTGAALDIEAAGVDRDSGAGIVMAPDAVDAVDVTAANRNGAPTVTSAPANRRVLRGAAAETVDVASAFSDPDNDPLTYRALSSAPGRVAVSLTGSQLRLSPLAAGRAVVTVRATDPSGLSAALTFTVTVAAPPPPPQPPNGGGGGGGFGGGGAPRTRAPSEPLNLTAAGGDGQVVLTWDAPEDDGGSPITDYEYRNVGRDPWTSTGSTDTTYTVTNLVNGTTYVFEVRAVNRNGKSFPSRRAEATPEVPPAPEKLTLDFPHFANGEGVTSEVVLLNVGASPVRPVVYFSDQQGEPIIADSVVDVTDDFEVQDDGGLTIRTAIEPLGELTVATHGRGEQVSGSVRVVAEGPIGGVLRYGVPGVGVTGVGTGLAVRDALFPARRQQGGIRTAAAMHNPGEEAIELTCRLMSGGVVLEEVEIALEANGQRSWFIEEAFAMTDTTAFTGTVRCTAPPGQGEYTGLAVEVDQANRIFTTLPVVPVDRTGGRDGETVLDFPHFANGTWVTDLVFVNPSIEASEPPLSPFHPVILASRPEIYFHDTGGALVPPASLVDLTGDLEVTEDGALTVRAAMEPLGVLTISTHGRGELLTGSVRVVSEGPLGGMLRFAHPSLGAAGVGAGRAVSDALVPVRRTDGGINTGIALHNLESSAGLVTCELRRQGVLLDTVNLPLAANGQTSWSIDQAFPAADTSDFTGSLRCRAPEGDLFTAVALEMDSGARTFTTLPVVPLEQTTDQE